jgi:hypothetical protein
MKLNIKQLATALLMVLSTATVYARPIVLPDPAVSASESGSFSTNANSQITLTGQPVSLTTSLLASGDVAKGSAKFKGGTLQYNDGSTNVDGKIARVTLSNEIKNGQVIYTMTGLVYGTLTQGGTTIDVNGDFSVTTKPAIEGTSLDQAQVNSSHLLVTVRSNINNTQP